MLLILKNRHLFVAALMIVASSFVAVAKSRFSQLVLAFDSKRNFNYSYHIAENALIFEIAKTNPKELAALEHYDENVIRRVLIRDLGAAGSEVRIVLRDRNIRAHITSFDEPFRIVVDFFDRDFNLERDPITGLPISGRALSSVTEHRPPDGLREPVEQPSSQDEDIDLNFTTPRPSEPGEPLAESKRKLLQPNPPLFNQPNDLIEALNKLPSGLGKGWKSFPVYVYRLQTAAFESERFHQEWLRKNAQTAVTSTEAMAEYGGKLFDFGHENRALLAYEQVLHKNPKVFDEDALHLWRFAEIHLGQGNLILADGYFQTLIDKHPESSLSKFAQVRRLDVKAIRALQTHQPDEFLQLGQALAKIISGKNLELKAQIAIRETYWQKHSDDTIKQIFEDKFFLPRLPSKVVQTLESALANVEGQKTAFLGASLLLHEYISGPRAWTQATGKFAGIYFQRFSGEATEPIRGHLEKQLKAKLDEVIQTEVQKKNYLQAIQNYEALPKSIQVIRETPQTAWALGEAYRHLGQVENSISFYQQAAQGLELGPAKFRAQFWLAVASGEILDRFKLVGTNQNKKETLTKISKEADSQLQATWEGLTENEQKELQIAMKDDLEKTITDPTPLKTPALIVLDIWTKALSTNLSTPNGEATEWKRLYSPSAHSVYLLVDLGKRFSSLGMENERQMSVALLKNLKPADFSGDKTAKNLWTDGLMTLANEYREANRFLDAGRIFAYTGSESSDWEGRASALYKGGLLLYRAGRREEAIEAFKKASEDGNNKFYANLAKERLNQLTK